MQKLNRKQFIQILAVGGGAAAAIKIGWDQLNAFHKVSETRLLMGTLVNLTIISDDEEAAGNGLTAALDKMEALEQVLSQYKAESQLSRLNTDGIVDGADQSLVDVLAEALRISGLSDGAFDITVKPLLNLYHKADGKALSDEQIAEAQALVDFKKISLRDASVSLADGMQITVDGIAKGYIVDQAVMVLRSFGLENVMVEAGGDLMASGGKDPDESWTIGVQSPRSETGSVLTSLDISNKAVATSGDYMQAFSDDLSLHHILDPRTGLSSPELASATVVASSVMLADALATTMMVMGPNKGLALIDSLADTEAMLVGKDLQEYRSAGFAG